MHKTVDIDSQIKDDALTLKLGGKTYTITDIPVETFRQALEVDEENVAELIYIQLSQILNVSVEELQSTVGMKAARIALDAIREWMLKDMQEGTEADQGPFDGNDGMQS